MPEAKYNTPDGVLAEAQSLAALPAGTVESRLEILRSRYREAPLLFTPETLQLLRQAGERAKQARAGACEERALATLKEVFGYPKFRAGQLEIISAAMTGRDCLGGMPTGAGKSVTYQIPARLMGGFTLGVSRLISLLKNQVHAPRPARIPPTFLKPPPP